MNAAADRVEALTRAWVERVVVGLDLCPFAAAPLQTGRLSVVVTPATTPEVLLTELAREMVRIADGDPLEVETTLLVHPHCLEDFGEYNDFLDVADALLRELKLEGVVQVASFHPDYRFADTEPDAHENYTNRSPYPMLHLLREASVTKAVDSLDDPAAIPKRNIARLRAMSPEDLAALVGMDRLNRD